MLAPASQFPLEPTNLVARDLDGDGDLDLVQLPANSTSGGFDPHAQWMENVGRRRFAPPRLCHVAPVAQDQWLERATFADLTGDSASEIFVSRWNATLPGRCEPLALTPSLDGVAPAVGVPLAAPSTGPWTALDLDGDGPAELLHFTSEEGAPVTLHVLERQIGGNYEETVTRLVPSRAGVSPWAEVTAVDMDQDGDLDLSLVDDSGIFQILERTGPRSFGSATRVVSYRTGDRWTDIDGDGLPDLLMSDGDWLQNLGGLAFAEQPELEAWQQVLPALWYSVVPRPGQEAAFHAVLAGPEEALVFANFSANSAVPEAEVPLPVPATSFPWFFLFEDLDGDGRPDLLLRAQTDNGSAALDVVWGSSKPVKKAARIFTAPSRFQSVHTGDFDEDGKTDLVIGPDGDGTFWLRRNRGKTGLGNPEKIKTLNQRRHFLEIVQTGDPNGDGHLDLVCRSVSLKSDGYEAVLAVAKGRGTGKFGRPLRPRGAPSASAFGGEWIDWDLDGDPDLVGAGQLQENTRGKFNTPPRHLIDLCNALDFLGNPVTIGFTRTGDLDGDGAPDIVSAIYGDVTQLPDFPFGSTFPNRAGIGFNDGHGGIGQIVEIPLVIAGTDFLGNPTMPGNLALADMDLDGDLDLCLREIDGSDLLGNPLIRSHWLENPGDGSRDPSSWRSLPIAGDVFPGSPLADFDGNGSPEWVSPNGYLKAADGGPVAVDGFHFTGDADLSASPLRAAADLDGDGLADFVVGGNGLPLLLIYQPEAGD